MQRYVISNLQLGRPSAIKKYDRPFKNVDEMDEHLIQSWNSVVKEGDLVYHLGNFAWDPKTAQSAISRMNGTIWFVTGEDDSAIVELAQKDMLSDGASIKMQIFPLKQMETTVSYWPLQDWPGKKDGYWSIIGNPSREYKSDPKERRINVSADLWNFKPQKLDHIIGIFNDL